MDRRREGGRQRRREGRRVARREGGWAATVLRLTHCWPVRTRVMRPGPRTHPAQTRTSSESLPARSFTRAARRTSSRQNQFDRPALPPSMDGATAEGWLVKRGTGFPHKWQRAPHRSTP